MTAHIPTYSPLEPVFAAHLEQMPSVFREQFLHSPDLGYDIVVQGHMHTIWYVGWLAPLFWALVYWES